MRVAFSLQTVGVLAPKTKLWTESSLLDSCMGYLTWDHPWPPAWRRHFRCGVTQPRRRYKFMRWTLWSNPDRHSWHHLSPTIENTKRIQRANITPSTLSEQNVLEPNVLVPGQWSKQQLHWNGCSRNRVEETHPSCTNFVIFVASASENEFVSLRQACWKAAF